MTTDLSILLPARNESAVLGATLDELHATLRPLPLAYELIVIDDYSTDATAFIAQQHGAIVYANVSAQGYGSAVRTGLAAARGEWVTIMTADGSDAPRDLIAYWIAAHAGAVDVVFGQRWGRGRMTGYPRLKYLGNRLGNLLIAAREGIWYTDWTNPFKLYRRTRIWPRRYTSRGMGLGLEIALHAARQTPFVVVETDWRPRVAGASKFRLASLWSYLRLLR